MSRPGGYGEDQWYIEVADAVMVAVGSSGTDAGSDLKTDDRTNMDTRERQHLGEIGCTDGNRLREGLSRATSGWRKRDYASCCL